MKLNDSNSENSYYRENEKKVETTRPPSSKPKIKEAKQESFDAFPDRQPSAKVKQNEKNESSALFQVPKYEPQKFAEAASINSAQEYLIVNFILLFSFFLNSKLALFYRKIMKI